MEHPLEEIPIFGQVDRFNARTENSDTILMQRFREIDRGLPAKLDDHPVGLLPVEDVEHVLERERLEIEAVRGIEVRADGFRVVIDDEGFVTGFPQRPDAVNGTVIELDA